MSAETYTAIVLPPSQDERRPDVARSARLHEATEFIGALAHELKTTIPVMEASLDVPPDGLLIVFGGGLPAGASIGPRTVLVKVSRSAVPGLLEELQLCAAIETHRFVQWQTDRQGERGNGVFGRRDVAGRMGARFGRAAGYPPETDNYGMLASDNCADLPALLARYLENYVALRGGIGAG